jgi:protein tyrosine/serine phosphatase
MSPVQRKWTRIALAVITAALLGVVVKHTRYYVFWDNFAEVEPGVLYRSAQLHPHQLRTAVKEYGLRAVFNLGHHNEEDEEEERLVRELGIRYLKTDWPGNGVVPEEALEWAYGLISDPANQPILVHCARGTHRTGVTVAYWRILRSTWSREQIREEMVAHRFHPESKVRLEALVDQLFAEHRKEGSAVGHPGPR